MFFIARTALFRINGQSALLELMTGKRLATTQGMRLVGSIIGEVIVIARGVGI